MSWLVLLLLAGIAALFDQACFAVTPVAPQAGLAVAGWVLIRTHPDEMPIRLWLVGLVLDAADPYSVFFYSLTLLGFGSAVLGIKRLVFGRSLVAWGLGTLVLVVVVHGFEVLLGARLDGGLRGSVAVAYGTAVLAMAGGWLLDILPPPWHPCGRPVA
jgi:hypothetical protein